MMHRSHTWTFRGQTHWISVLRVPRCRKTRCLAVVIVAIVTGKINSLEVRVCGRCWLRSCPRNSWFVTIQIGRAWKFPLKTTECSTPNNKTRLGIVIIGFTTFTRSLTVKNISDAQVSIPICPVCPPSILAAFTTIRRMGGSGNHTMMPRMLKSKWPYLDLLEVSQKKRENAP